MKYNDLERILAFKGLFSFIQLKLLKVFQLKFLAV